MQWAERFLRNEQGGAILEYAFLVALLALAAVTVLNAAGTALR